MALAQGDVPVRGLDIAGIDARFLYLPDHGITGNGHMMMLERNNREVLQAIRVIAL